MGCRSAPCRCPPARRELAPVGVFDVVTVETEFICYYCVATTVVTLGDICFACVRRGAVLFAFDARGAGVAYSGYASEAVQSVAFKPV